MSDLALIRTKGLVQLRHVRLESLHRAAQLCGLAVDGYATAPVEKLLRAAVSTLGEGKLGTAAAYTFGLVSGTRDWPSYERRRRGAEIYGVGVDRFRKHYEKIAVSETANAILEMCLSRSTPEDDEVEPVPERGAAGDGSRTPIRTVEKAGDFALSRLLPGATQVDLYGRTMVSLLNQYAHHLAALVRDGCAVRVLVLDPDVQLGENLYPLVPGAGGETLRHNAVAMGIRFRLLLEAHAQGSGSVTIRTTTYLPPFSMVRCVPRDVTGSKVVAQISLMFTRTGRDRPLLCLDHDNPWHDVFVAEFEEAWRRARSWDSGPG